MKRLVSFVSGVLRRAMKNLTSNMSGVLRKIDWRKVGRIALSALPLVVIGGQAVFASGLPSVNYGTTGSLGHTVNQELENLAATVQYILGGTALLALVIAALVNHFVHDPRSKDRAKEIVVAAIVGLLIAAFAPDIVNWIGHIH